MAITFSSAGMSRRKQQFLVIVFFGTLLVISFVIWKGFFQKEIIRSPKGTENVIPPKKVEIRFDILKEQGLELFEMRPAELPFEETIGRSNPFVPIQNPLVPVSTTGF